MTLVTEGTVASDLGDRVELRMTVSSVKPARAVWGKENWCAVHFWRWSAKKLTDARNKLFYVLEKSTAFISNGTNYTPIIL